MVEKNKKTYFTSFPTLLLRLKRPKHDADHSRSPCVEVKNERHTTSTLSIVIQLNGFPELRSKHNTYFFQCSLTTEIKSRFVFRLKLCLYRVMNVPSLLHVFIEFAETFNFFLYPLHLPMHLQSKSLLLS
jgi:hypothetical protein